MKERFGKFLNKNLKMIIIIAILIAVAMGMLLMLISGNDEDRDAVPVDPTAEQQETKPKKERKLAQSVDHPGVSDVALNLYNARVDDIKDTVQVAQLLEASEMRKEMGGYLATIDTEDGTNMLIITYETPLKAGEDTVFDESATWYAEQFLALIEEADMVKWVYKVEKDPLEVAEEKEKLEAERAAKEKEEKEKAEKEKSDKDSDKDKKESKESDKEKEEIKVDPYKKVEKSLTTTQADELLGIKVKDYSESPELVQTLLNNQKGIV